VIGGTLSKEGMAYDQKDIAHGSPGPVENSSVFCPFLIKVTYTIRPPSHIDGMHIGD
jgi:hypothetical protein